MYRIIQSDGSLSDMLNLTRVMDALRAQQERERDIEKKRRIA